MTLKDQVEKIRVQGGWTDALELKGIRYISFDTLSVSDILALCSQSTGQQEGKISFEWYYDISFLFYRIHGETKVETKVEIGPTNVGASRSYNCG